MNKQISPVDPVRKLCWEVLQAVQDQGAYVNLLLPGRISEHKLGRRDAAFATELTYGTLRNQVFYDWVVEKIGNRPTDKLELGVLIALRLGLHQLFNMRVAEHAAVNETVNLVRQISHAGSAKLANAILRQVLRQDLDSLRKEAANQDGKEAGLALTTSHPAWIIAAYQQALKEGEKYGAQATADPSSLRALLAANNQAPQLNLVARPGLISRKALAEQVMQQKHRVKATPISPWGLVVDGGDPGRIPAIRQHLGAVEDQGSQLVAGLAALHPVLGSDQNWLDLCAGPGGKAALMAAIGAEKGAFLDANEVQPHRAELVAQSVQALQNVAVHCEDGRTFSGKKAYDRVLVDAPCTGLGALRRHPESRYRQRHQVISDLANLQRQLLNQALDLTRPGGIVVYATCSPHLSETIRVVESALRRRDDFQVENPASTVNQLIDRRAWPNGLGCGSHFMQLWPHLHQADAMFAAVLRKV